MDIMQYFVVRDKASACLVWHDAFGRPVLDVAAPATMFNLPDITGRLLVLFIYGYVFSTGLKVWIHTAKHGGRLKQETEDAKPTAKERLEEFITGKKLPDTDQRFFFATTHYMIAYAGLVVTVLILLVSLAFVPGVAFLPIAALMVAVIYLLNRIVPSVVRVVDTISGAATIEDELETKEAKPSFLRNLTGWFTDVVELQEVTPLHMTLTFPYQFLSAENRDSGFYSTAFRQFWDFGGGNSDAGFLTLTYGFQIFFLCLALAPVSCCKHTELTHTSILADPYPSRPMSYPFSRVQTASG